jgi:hypothetical protein
MTDPRGALQMVVHRLILDEYEAPPSVIFNRMK